MSPGTVRILKSAILLCCLDDRVCRRGDRARDAAGGRTVDGRGICKRGGCSVATDIQKMGAGRKQTALSVTMHKHPDSFMPVAGSREHLACRGRKRIGSGRTVPRVRRERVDFSGEREHDGRLRSRLGGLGFVARRLRSWLTRDSAR